MQSRVALSLFISFLFILGASWSRFSKPESYTTGLELVAQNDALTREYIELKEYNPSPTATSSSPSPLTDTDLVARQLTIDYLDLVSKGQATDKNLKSLASFYTDNLPNIISTPVITLSEVNIITDTKQNITSYGNTVANIYFKYEELLANEFDGTENGFSAFSPEVVASAKKVSQAYRDRAEEMKKISVPQSLASTHIGLVNNYLAESAYFGMIANAESDPVRAFAALASQINKKTESDSLLVEMVETFNSYGI